MSDIEKSEDWQVVYRGHDPVQLHLMEELLHSEDIPSRRLGPAYAALLGVGDSAVIQMISVPSSCVGDAKRVIAEIDNIETSEAAELEHHVPPTRVAGKTRLIAIGMSVLWPGLGLAYSGSALPGLALAAWSLMERVHPGPYDAAVASVLFAHGVARIVDAGLSQALLTYYKGRTTQPFFLQLMAAFVLVNMMYWSLRLIGVPVTKLTILALQKQAG